MRSQRPRDVLAVWLPMWCSATCRGRRPRRFSFATRWDVSPLPSTTGGSFWKLPPRGGPHAEELWTRAVDLVSQIVPGALTERDPVAFRHMLFRIAVGDASDREARTKPIEQND